MNDTFPPVGFIVEGHGEYHSYDYLISRILGKAHVKPPISNARGYGNVVRNLGTELGHLVKLHHPHNVIVTVDLKDILDQGLYANCIELASALNRQATDWINSVENKQKFQPLPERIVTVIQIQTFETWLLSDIRNLCLAKCITTSEQQIANVDESISDPCAWLQTRLSPTLSTKNPKNMKKMIYLLDPAIMRCNSRSFDKFFREIEKACQIGPCPLPQ